MERIEKVVSGNQDIVQEIFRLADDNVSRIYVSSELYEHLRKHYKPTPFFDHDGSFFHNDKRQTIGITSKKADVEIYWKEVTSFPFSDISICKKPKVLYFLTLS